jgi:hypothetical protein
VQSKYGIDAAFVKHHILLQDHDSQAAAAETAEGSKKNGERRMYMQNPHKTAAVKELSVSCQLLLQHLLTLLREVRLHARPVVLYSVRIAYNLSCTLCCRAPTLHVSRTGSARHASCSGCMTARAAGCGLACQQ